MVKTLLAIATSLIGGAAGPVIYYAIHEGDQFPSESAQATEELQITLVRLVTSAAYSLSTIGKFDYAWASLDYAHRIGKSFAAKSELDTD